jgi:hypothetical protein
VANFKSFLRNPFSFLFTKTSAEDRIAAYVIREHERGRSLEEILDDPYVRNRTSDSQRLRILERPEVTEALGRGVVAETRDQLS